MKKILVAVDGSENSKRAILKARLLADKFNSEVALLNVTADMTMNPYASMREHSGVIEQVFNKEGNKVVDDALKAFGPYEGKIKGYCKSGDPGDKIIEIAEKEAYDLIVMGSRGLNPISRVMVGSVSNKVLNNSHTSVLIVK